MFLDAVSIGLVNLSQMGLSMLIKRCGSSLKHFVMESPKISEKVC